LSKPRIEGRKELGMKTILLAAALASTPGSAQRDAENRSALCNQLRQAVAAAYERPALASLAANPGQDCTLSGEGDYRRLRCEQRVAPVTDAWQRLNATIMRCFPHAIRMAEAESEQRIARFRFGLIAIHTEHRNIGFRGGSFISYTVMRLPVH
jgi:hypothetical protein